MFYVYGSIAREEDDDVVDVDLYNDDSDGDDGNDLHCLHSGLSLSCTFQ